MPVLASIKFAQGVTTDIAGRALIGVTAVAAVMTNGDNTDVFDWTWELLTKPAVSAIPIGVIAAGAVATASFTPDVAGSYLARLTVKDTAGNQAQDTRAFIVREGSGRIIPPFRGDFASLNYGGQGEGWDPAMESWLHSMDGRQPLVNATTGSIDNIPSLDLVDSAAAEGIRFTNGIAPLVRGIAGGYGGRRIYVMAAGASVGLANENAGSLAQNRIITGTSADVSLQSGSIAWLVYDSAALRWRAQPVASGGGGGVPAARTLTAGAGLTGGGDLTLDRTFDVIGNADGSIIANANDVQVGVLATDVQHGVRGGGTQHANATGAVAGFMTAANFTKLAGIASGAASAILQWGNDGVVATTTTRYLTPGYEAASGRTTVVPLVVPRAGTLQNFRVRQNVGAGNGNAIVYTIRINGVASALSISMASTANNGGPDVDTVIVAAGDLVDIEVTKALNVVTSPSDIVATVVFAA